MRQIKTPYVEKRVLTHNYNVEVFFSMGTRVSYPVEVKLKAIKMRLAGVPVKQVLEELNIRNHIWLAMSSERKET